MGWPIIPVMALSIPILAIILTHRKNTHVLRIRELELQKEILELEIKNQNNKIILLEAENKNLDKIINQ